MVVVMVLRLFRQPAGRTPAVTRQLATPRRAIASGSMRLERDTRRPAVPLPPADRQPTGRQAVCLAGRDALRWACPVKRRRALRGRNPPRDSRADGASMDASGPRRTATPVGALRLFRLSRRVPSNTRTPQWDNISHLFPQGDGSTGRPRTNPLQEVVNACLYLARGGCTWRMPPTRSPRSWSSDLGMEPSSRRTWHRSISNDDKLLLTHIRRRATICGVC
jgi:hypothetical protein